MYAELDFWGVVPSETLDRLRAFPQLCSRDEASINIFCQAFLSYLESSSSPENREKYCGRDNAAFYDLFLQGSFSYLYRCGAKATKLRQLYDSSVIDDAVAMRLQRMAQQEHVPLSTSQLASLKSVSEQVLMELLSIWPSYGALPIDLQRAYDICFFDFVARPDTDHKAHGILRDEGEWSICSSDKLVRAVLHDAMLLCEVAVTGRSLFDGDHRVGERALAVAFMQQRGFHCEWQQRRVWCFGAREQQQESPPRGVSFGSHRHRCLHLLPLLRL